MSSPTKRDSTIGSDQQNQPPPLTNRVSTNDLKNQLVDLQKKLSSSRRSSNNPIQNSNTVSPTQSQSQSQHSSQPTLITSRATKRSSLSQQNNENLEPPIHLPPVSLSAFQEELRASRRETHSSLTRNRRSHQPASNPTNRFSAPAPQSANVDFLSDLSDGLLIESRRLQADNKHLKQELSKQKDENSTILKQIQNLTVLNKKLSEQEESLQDKNWDLESELNKLKRKFNDTNQELLKVNKKHETNSNELNSLKNELNTLTVLKDNLLNDLESTRSKYNSEVKELKQRVVDLNDENDNLHLKNQKLTDLVNDSKSINSKNIPVLTPINNEFNDDELNTILNDPNLLKFQSNNNNNSTHELEKETLQTNLNHAYSSILRLRNHLVKLKSENQDLEKKLSSNEKSNNDIKSPLKSTIKSLKKSVATPRKSLSPNKRNSKNISYEEANESNFSWENYSEDESTTREAIPKLTNSSDEDEDEDDASHFQFVNSSSNTINSKNKKTNKFLSDELHELEHENDDNSILINRESIEKYANEHNLVIVPTDEYEELKAIHQHHKLEEKDVVVKAATSFDLLALPNDSKSSKSIIETLKQKCHEFNLIPLTQEEHEKLVYLSEREPNESEMERLLSLKGLTVLKNVDHQDLLETKTHLETKLNDKSVQYDTLQKENNVLVESINKLEVLNKAEKDKVSSAEEKLSLQGTELLSYIDKLKTVEDKLNQPDLNYLKEKATQRSMILLPTDEHKSLVKDLNENKSKIQNPSLQFIKESVSNIHNDKVKLLTIDEYQKYVDISNQLNEKTDYLSSIQKELDFKSTELQSVKTDLELKQKEIEDYQHKLNSPDLEYIKSKALVSHNMTMIPLQELDTMKSDLSKANSELDDLQKQVSIKLKELAEKDSKLVSQSDEISKQLTKVEELQSQLNSPSLEFIKSKSGELGYKIIEESKFSDLQTQLDDYSKEIDQLKIKLEEPDLDYILEKSKSHQHVVIAADEHKKLNDQIKSHTKEINSLKSSLDEREKELNSTVAKLENPDLNYIMEKSSSHDHVVLPVTKHKELERKLKSQSSEIETLRGTVDLKTKELENTKSTFESPDLKYIMEKSSSHGHVVIPADEINNLKSDLDSKNKELKDINTKFENPDLQYIMEKSSSHGHVVIPADEHKKLTDENKQLTSTVLSKEDEIESLKTDLDSKSKELSSVKSTLDTPDLEYIMEKSSSHNHVVLPVSEHESINNKLKSHSEEITNLKKSLESSQTELETFKSQIENPDLNYLKSKSSTHDHVLLPIEEHKKLKGTVESQSNEIENLKSSLDSSKKELSDIQTKLETPDLGYLKEKASSIHGHEILSADDLNNYTTEISKHTSRISELEKSLDDSNSQLADPSEQYLREKAQSKYLVLLPIEEHNNLKASIDKPSIEAAKKALDGSSKYKVLTTKEFNKLENPSKNDLITKASGLGLIAVDSATYKSMKGTVEKPSLAFLAANLNTYDYKAIPQKEFDSMSKAISTASTAGGAASAVGGSVLGGAAGVASAGVVGAVGVASAIGAAGTALASDITAGFSGPKRSYSSNSTTPTNSTPSSPVSKRFGFESGVETIESLKRKCTEMGLVAVSKSTYESSIISSKRQLTFVELKERVEQLAQIMLPKAEFDELLSIFGSQGPAFRDALMQLSGSGGDHATALIELRTLTDNQNKVVASFEKPNIDYFKEKASDLGLFVIPLNDYKKLESGANWQKNAKDNGFVLVKEEAHDALKASATSQEEKIKTLESQLESALNPTTEVCLAVIAKDDNYKVLTSNEYKELLDSIDSPSKEKVIEMTKVYSLTALSNEEYQDLLDQLKTLKESVENPELEHLKEKLSSHNFIALPVSDHDAMKSLVSNKDKELSSVNEELNSHKLEIEKVNKELSSTKEVHESVLGELETHKADIEKVNKELLSAQELHKTASTELDSHKEEIQSLKAELESLKEAISNKESEHNTLTEQLESLKTELDEKTKTLDTLNSSLESPDLDYLHTKAASHKMILTPSEDHDTLSTKLNDSSKQLLELQALHDSKIEEIDELKKSLDSKEAEISTLNQKLELPELEYIKEKAESHQMTVLPSEEHLNLKSDLDNKKEEIEKHSADIVSLKEQLGLKSKELETISAELADLKKFHSNPSKEYIMEKAGSHSLVLLSSDEHDVLQKGLLEKEGEVDKYSTDILTIKEELESKYKEIDLLTAELQAKQTELDELNSPSKDYITEKAKSHSMVLLSSEDHDSLQKELSRNQEEVETHKSDIALLKEQNDSKSAELEKLAAELESKKTELDTINQQYTSPSAEYIKEKATVHSLVAIPVDDHSNLLKDLTSKTESIESTNTELAARSAEIETLNKTIAEVKVKYEDALSSLNSKDEELEQLKQTIFTKSNELDELNAKLEDPDLDYIHQKALGHDFVAVDGKSYRELQSTVERPSVDYITSKAGIYGLKVLTLEEYKQLLESSNQPAPSIGLDVARSILGSAGFVTLSESDHKTLQQARAAQDNSVSKEDYNSLQKQFDDKSLLLTQLQDYTNGTSYVYEKAKELGLFVVSKAEYDSYEALESENKELKNANASRETKPILSAPQSNMSVESIQTHSDTVYIDAVSSMEEDNDEEDDNQSDQSSIFDSNEEEQLRERAAKLGFDLIPIQKYDDDDDTSVGSVSDDDDDDDEKNDDEDGGKHELGYAHVEKLDAGSSFDPEELRVKAGVLGYELIEAKELERLRGFENIDITRLRDLASQMGMNVTDATTTQDAEREIPAMSLESLQEAASSMGYFVLSKSDIDRLKKRTITTQELASKAAELNLSLLSEADVQNMKVARGSSVADLENEATAKGFMMIPKSQFVATTVSRTPDVNNVIVLPSTYYNKLIRSHEWYKKNGMKSEVPTPTVATSYAPPPPVTAHTSHIDTSDIISQSDSLVQYSPRESPQLQENNRVFSLSDLARQHSRTALSLHTVDSTISFSSRDMIAVITQTIIGEYLYKYYRKLGPFSSLSESRHERYFWIHPYSLTLYWSTSNPVLGDPSENKIRAIAIVSAESVEDKNPLPPGVYHKSIIIHSPDRSIKITCPTRQRHNIWFNSLRYLIERSTDDLVDDDDDIENQYNEPYSYDERVEVERSQSFRHDRPKNSLSQHLVQNHEGVAQGQRSMSAQMARNSSKSMLGSIGQRGSRFR